MASLANTELQPPYIMPTAVPRAGRAAYAPSARGGTGKAAGTNFEPPSPELWAAIVDAFRAHPGHAVNAARRVGEGCTPAYAKYAWENGWWNVEGCETMIPVRDLFVAETSTARALVVRTAEATPETVDEARAAAKREVALAVQDLGEARGRESATLRLVVGLTQQALASSKAFTAILPKLYEQAAKHLQEEMARPSQGTDKNGRKKSSMNRAQDYVRILRAFTELQHLQVTQAKAAAEMRKHLYNEPTATLVLDNGPPDFSHEDALAELREGERLLKRYSPGARSDIIDMPEPGQDGDELDPESDSADLDDDNGDDVADLAELYGEDEDGEDPEDDDEYAEDEDPDPTNRAGSGYVREVLRSSRRA